MIKIEKEKLEITGKHAEIRAEFCTLLKNMREYVYPDLCGEKALEEFERDIELSKLSTEMLIKRVIEKLSKELLEEIKEKENE